MTNKRNFGKEIAAKAQSTKGADLPLAANAKVTIHSLVAEDFFYTFDMFIMPLKAVWSAIASGFRRNLFEIEKQRPKNPKDHLPTSVQ